MLWDGSCTHVLVEGTRADIAAQTDGLRASGLRATDAPKLPEGPHRGRISVAPGALGSLAAALRDVRWCAELGVGTVHVAADTTEALTAARDAPTRTAAGSCAKPAATDSTGSGATSRTAR